MADASITKLLASLEGPSRKLNAASDAVNKVIEQLETRLVKMNPGLPVWITLSSESWEDENEGAGTTDVELGFDKLAGEWRVAVRRATYRCEGDDFRAINTAPGAPLIEAAREIRIAALREFPKLVQRVKGAVEGALDAIEEAKALVR